MNTTFNAGDTVYSQSGHEAEFVAKSDGSYIVRPAYEDDDGTQYGKVETWGVVFRTPPAPKLDAETAAAEKRLAEIDAKVNALLSQQHEFQVGEKARLERIKRHEQLADLDRYLAGEMTHYVATHDYYPSVEIIPVGNTIESYANGSGYGLLHLSPSKHWDKKIRWTVTYKTPGRNVYSRTSLVIPCCGLDDANAKAAELVRAYLTDYEAKGRAKWSYAEELVKSCQKFNVEVPQWLFDGIAEGRRLTIESRIAESRQKLAAAEGELAAIASTAGSAS